MAKTLEKISSGDFQMELSEALDLYSEEFGIHKGSAIMKVFLNNFSEEFMSQFWTDPDWTMAHVHAACFEFRLQHGLIPELKKFSSKMNVNFDIGFSHMHEGIDVYNLEYSTSDNRRIGDEMLREIIRGSITDQHIEIRSIRKIYQKPHVHLVTNMGDALYIIYRKIK